MASTALFEGYLPEEAALNPPPRLLHPQSAQSSSQGSVATVTGYSSDNPAHTPSASAPGHSPSHSMSSAVSTNSAARAARLGPEGEQPVASRYTSRELHAMPEEEDDEQTVGGRSRSGSALPTPNASSLSFQETIPGDRAAGGAGAAAQTSSRLSSQKPQQQSSGERGSGSATVTRKPSTAPHGSTVPSNARIRTTPRLPNHAADPAPSTVMYWSRAPVYGHLPHRAMRAHTVTLIDNLAWQIGGCDHQSCSNEVLTFDTETMQWAHPDTVGDGLPPCRAHSATQVDRRIFIFGGGEGPTYYNHLYVLDTTMRRWHRVNYPQNIPQPIARRAHATWFYQGKVYLFGGGNGAKALNDLWTLDVSVPYDRMRWESVEVRGPKPRPRGYHTANLVGDSVVVIGGSDGSECFKDVWVLNLERYTWQEIKTDGPTKRLSHTSTQVGSYLFVMGGHDGSKYNHDLLLFNLVTLQWEPRETRGKYPSSRGYHATILADSRLFVFGGFDGQNCFDDVYILDLAAAAYLPQVTSFGLAL